MTEPGDPPRDATTPTPAVVAARAGILGPPRVPGQDVPSDHPLPTPPTPPSTAAIPLVSARSLIGASFDLLLRSGREMRRASFYVGLIILGTVAPFVVGLAWMLGQVPGMGDVLFDPTYIPTDEDYAGMDGAGIGPASGFLIVALMLTALAGLWVALIESRSIAMVVLGGTHSGRRVTTRQAVARARRTFWRAVAASIIVWIPLTVAQTLVQQVTDPTGQAVEFSLVTSTIVTALVGAPLAYVAAGVVLGDVDPLEALKRSIALYRVRTMAAVVVVLFETVTVVLIVLGLSSGVEIVIRVFEAVGFSADGSVLGTVGLLAAMLAVVFALGTLIYTVTALTVAPQIVMFLGLTHATFGLDRVRAGGPDDPDGPRQALRPFRWLTMPMGIAIGSSLIATLLLVWGA